MKYNKIVIWGLRKKYHTHRFIHKAFYENAQKLGFKVIWVEDEKENAHVVEKGDLVISAEMVGKMVPEKTKFEDYNLPIVDGVYYCLHHFKEIFTDKIDKRYLLKLCVYTNNVESSDQKWGDVTYYDSKTQTLSQPWGTHLLYEEFKKPVFNKNKTVYWVGSIWNDKNNHGNIGEINKLKEVLIKYGLKFKQVRFIPEWLNSFFVRKSRIAPAIGGEIQVKVNYLPCRMFKNISFGQLAFSNIKKFNDILKEYNIYSENMDEMVNRILKLSKEEYIDVVKHQQELIKNYTYKNSLENIFRAFDQIELAHRQSQTNEQ